MIYVFKNALVQDVAYESLLKSKRQQLHTRITQLLEKHFPDTVENAPELLAHHYAEAGLADSAVDYWLKAGQRARQRFALSEAVAHLKNGLELIATLSDPERRGPKELDLQIALGTTLIAAKGYAAPETGTAYSRALLLCQQLGNPPQLFPALYGAWAYHELRGDHDDAAKLAERSIAEGERRQDIGALVIAHRMMGLTRLSLGQLSSARDHLEKAVSLYEPEEHRALTVEYGQNPCVSAKDYLAIALQILGAPVQGLAQSREAIELAEAEEHLHSLAHVYYFGSLLHMLRKEPRLAHDMAEGLVRLCSEQGFVFWLQLGRFLLGWAAIEMGGGRENMAAMRQSLADYNATGASWTTSTAFAALAEAAMKLGDAEQAREALADGLAAATGKGERWWDAEIHRLHGELTLADSGSREDAEAHFTEAIRISRNQDAKSWELRAATALARLWQGHGKAREAHDLLETIYGWFTEGFDTADLKEAKALLDELR
jgi:predicted ATPase